MDRKAKSVWRAVCLMGGLCVWGIAVAPGHAAVESGSLNKMIFGNPDGTPVELYVLKNGQITVKVMTYGAIITEIDTPDRNGKEGDVVLGFDRLERLSRPATRTSGRRSAALPTGSPRESSP